MAMYRKTTVDLPVFVREDEDVKEWLQDNPDRWREAVDEDVWQLDPRATYLEHEIEQIDVADGEILVQYTVEYDLYYGCRDINASGTDSREIVGKVIDGRVIFQTFEQPDPQARVDEI